VAAAGRKVPARHVHRPALLVCEVISCLCLWRVCPSAGLRDVLASECRSKCQMPPPPQSQVTGARAPAHKRPAPVPDDDGTMTRRPGSASAWCVCVFDHNMPRPPRQGIAVCSHAYGTAVHIWLYSGARRAAENKKSKKNLRHSSRHRRHRRHRQSSLPIVTTQTQIYTQMAYGGKRQPGVRSRA
jgi:hypothetical protein